MTKHIKAKIGIYISGEEIISVIRGISEFWSITFSNPLPIETAKNIWGIIPISVAKKKLVIFTLKIVGKRQLSCQGTPPTKRYINKYKNSDKSDKIPETLRKPYRENHRSHVQKQWRFKGNLWKS